MQHPAPRHVELSHLIEDGMAAFPGLPSPRIYEHLSHAESRSRYQGKAQFAITALELVGNTGTYLDAPYHRFSEGADIAALPLAAVAGLSAAVVDAQAGAERGIVADPSDVEGHAVLFRTGWDRRWGTQAYWEPGPFLAAETVDALIVGGAALVGVDCWNVDDTADLARPAHTRLLGAGVLIVEHLRGLDQLPHDGFRFSAVPLRVAGAASLAVRAFAEIPAAPDSDPTAGRQPA